MNKLTPLFITGSLAISVGLALALAQSKTDKDDPTTDAVAPLFMNSRGDRNCVFAGRSADISCSDTVPDTSSTTRTQTELPFGGAAMNSVSTPPVAMAKLAPMSVNVGAPVPSFVTSCQRVWVPATSAANIAK